MRPIIKVRGVSKQYRIGMREEYSTLREALVNAVRNPGSYLQKRNENGTVWALRDVNFEVQPSEVVGIIGRNGAGKSTLLKILSRITKPTKGEVDIYGRVGCLLEVGTGFHPELTGRENVFLNGAILGMTRTEISQKFDEIVAFAEVEKFLDTPVKRYSSGMNLRLAFAVAAHLDPEILIVDEVLAVGDSAFQKKCLGKINSVAKEGRTVLFVSHQLPTMQQLCTKAFLLEDGRIVATGKPPDVIGQYLSHASSASSLDIRNWEDRETTGEARLVALEIRDDKGQVVSSIPVGGHVSFLLRVEFYQPIVDPSFGVIIHNALGEPLLDLRSTHSGFRVGTVERGDVTVEAHIDKIGLYPGRYFLSLWVSDSRAKRNIDFVKVCCSIQVDPELGLAPQLKLDPMWGKYWIDSNWNINGRS